MEIEERMNKIQKRGKNKKVRMESITSKKVWVVGGGRGRVSGLCAAAPRCVRAAFAAQTRAFGANTIKF